MKTCENCGLGIIWEGMIVETKTGHICHPDCKPDQGAPAKVRSPDVLPGAAAVAEAPREARPLRRGRDRRGRKESGR